MARAFLFVLDSFGIGGAPDADKFGDLGSDTLGHIAEYCSANTRDEQPKKSKQLFVPVMESLGLGLAAQHATGNLPSGFSASPSLIGRYANAAEVSTGKDTPSGHWEIAGLPVSFEWGYFQREYPSFPPELIADFCGQCALDGILGNVSASGTQIIQELGEEHQRSGKPICYTSSDSVFQIAAHEETFGLERLYSICEIARKLLDPLNIGRVIARPFMGNSANTYERTGNRRDFAIPPTEPTLLDRAKEAGRQVIAIGKIADIYANQGPTKTIKAIGNQALFEASMESLDDAEAGDLVMTNFVDFDMLYGHRRDVAGYAAALERFDQLLPKFMQKMKSDDLLILTADHGCDPTWTGSDHTREQVPVLLWSPQINPGYCGARQTFSDIGETVADHLGLPAGKYGRSFL